MGPGWAGRVDRPRPRRTYQPSALTVETYLSQEAAAVEVTSPVEYFRFILCATGDPAAVAQRGRDAGAALGADAAEAVAGIADRVLARVSAAEEDSLVATPVGGMRLIDYLLTRTFELTVHTCDLAAALGQGWRCPRRRGRKPEPARRARDQSRPSGPLLLAATGRGSLPAGFTVLWLWVDVVRDDWMTTVSLHVRQTAQLGTVREGMARIGAGRRRSERWRRGVLGTSRFPARSARRRSLGGAAGS